jgi:hypothetical protein
MDTLTRLTHDLANDLSGRGPLRFRLILQPAAAVFFAVRAAMSDAREGNPAFFFLGALIDPVHRRAIFRETWQDVGKVFVTAAVVESFTRSSCNTGSTPYRLSSSR